MWKTRNVSSATNLVTDIRPWLFVYAQTNRSSRRHCSTRFPRRNGTLHIAKKFNRNTAHNSRSIIDLGVPRPTRMCLITNTNDSVVRVLLSFFNDFEAGTNVFHTEETARLDYEPRPTGPRKRKTHKDFQNALYTNIGTLKNTSPLWIRIIFTAVGFEGSNMTAIWYL